MRSTFSGTMGLGRAKAFVFGAAMMVAILLELLLVVNPAYASTFTVINTDDSSPGSLRQAITDANNDNAPTVDTINFNIPTTDPGCNATSGVCTINPSSELPPITDPVIINGYTQGDGTPGDPSDDATENTLAVGNNAELKIKLNGVDAANGLKIEASGSTVKGLVISNWENGVFLNTEATGNTVRGNFIGTDASGDTTLGNNIGVVALGPNEPEPPGNTIGGTTAAARNIISGNGSDGVEILYTLPEPPPSPPPDPATGNRILSNSIYDNDALGINLVHSNNLTEGVTPNDTLPPPDSDAGPNNLQNYPDLDLARTRRGVTTIKGTLTSTPGGTFVIQFFSSLAADPSGFGEGQRFKGQKSVTDTDGDGIITFTFKTKKKVPTGQLVTATATDEDGNTSEFSKACEVPGVPCP